MARLVQTKHPKERTTYDPETSYKWDPDDIFEITGKQLAAFYHLLSHQMNTPGGAPVSFVVRAHETVMDILKMGIEQGVIVPMEQEAESKVKALFDNQVSEAQ